MFGKKTRKLIPRYWGVTFPGVFYSAKFHAYGEKGFKLHIFKKATKTWILEVDFAAKKF